MRILLITIALLSTGCVGLQRQEMEEMIKTCSLSCGEGRFGGYSHFYQSCMCTRDK